MIRHAWTVACMHAVIDQESNLASLLDVIEQINIPEQPAPDKIVGVSLDLTSLWFREELNKPEKGRTRITLVSPSGVELKTLTIEIDLSDHERLRTRGRFVGIPAPEDGLYGFRVESVLEDNEDWKEVASIPLRIAFTKEEPAVNS